MYEEMLQTYAMLLKYMSLLWKRSLDWSEMISTGVHICPRMNELGLMENKGLTIKLLAV